MRLDLEATSNRVLVREIPVRFLKLCRLTDTALTSSPVDEM